MNATPSITAGWFDWQASLASEAGAIEVIVRWNSWTQVTLDGRVIHGGWAWAGYVTVPLPGEAAVRLRLWWFPVLMVSISGGSAARRQVFWKDTVIWAAKCGILGLIIGTAIGAFILLSILGLRWCFPVR